ncbi:iron ABC transporter ATP-binding protein [Tropheryma whipplei str. Twist]|uniref:Iron ABC transporter ATP-binding protein n=2 Tax=Tropheryma whipplei TaxID=2039 RepID=Q83H10_TROWT|nr:iron ABC transporter ATP-binding protein [Tropheryma whipplei str. Twist]
MYLAGRICFIYLSGEQMITVDKLSFSYGKNKVLHDISIEIKRGSFIAIIGANGCGKSTFLRSIAGLNRFEGDILLDKQHIRRLKPKNLAKHIAFLPQQVNLPEGLTIADLVSRGRYPHQSILHRWTKTDEEVVKESLQAVQASHISQRAIEAVSGGQRQRALIAMVLAQQTRILLLDEPTTFLDIAYQYEILELLASLNRESKTIICSLHDLNQAARYASHLFVMGEGRIIASGEPKKVITENLIENAFGLKSRIIDDPESNTPMIIPRKSENLKRL